VTINFSTPMDPVGLSNPGNYVLVGGTIQSITVNSNTYQNVILTVTGNPTSVTVNNIVGLGGGLALGGNHTATINKVLLTSVDIGVVGPPVDPAVPSGFYPSGTNAFLVECEGSDIWNANDGFNFSYEMKTGDFDVVVRQKSITHTSNWAKGGLMVRESLNADSRDWNIVNDPILADGIQAPDNSGMGANAVECNVRNATAAASGGWGNGTAMVPAYPNAWVRLKRAGNVLSAYASNDGKTWTLMGQQDPSTVGAMTPLPATVYVGICTTAHNNDGNTAPPFLYYNTAEYADYNSSYVPPAGAATLTAAHVGNNIVISWTPTGGKLQSCTALGGAWTDEGTANPATIPITGTAKFFRVAQ